MNSRFISRYLLFYGIFCLSWPAYAAIDPALLHQKKTDLARNFVSKLKNKLIGGESPIDSQGISQRDSGKTQIPEGSDLLFRPRIDKYTLEGNIYGVKGADDFYLSLTDLITVLNFPIKISEDGKSAAGWFIREGWDFQIDVPSRTVVSRGQSYSFTNKDFQDAPGDVLISGRLLGEWLGMTYIYDVSQQYVEIKADYVFPIVAQIERRQRRGVQQRDNVAVLPRKEYEYDMASLSTADVSVRSNYRRSANSGNSDLVNSTSVGVNGQFFKNDARVFTNLDDREGLNSVTATLSRDSDRAELLGPLKARSYALGDTTTVDVPLTGQASLEFGARVSSNPLASVNYQDTRISGNALPGWDVELYRNEALIDTLTVDETGRFEFDNVQLYAGDNFFDIYFYGFQGEVRKESLNLPLTSESLLAQSGTYDFSVTTNDQITYRREDSDDEDQGTVRAAGKYNFFVGDALAYAGFQALQEGGDQKLYLGGGATHIWNGFIFDTNLAADEMGEMAARLGIRKNINDWNLALSTQVNTDQFTEGTDTDNPTVFELQGSVYRSYTPFIGLNGNIFADAGYRELADGGTSHTAGLGLSQGFRNLSLTNVLRHDETSPVTGGSTERFTDDLSARVRLSRQLSSRAGVTYQIRPESKMDKYFATLNYQPKSNLSIDLQVDHDLETKVTETELRANYLHDKFRLSPYVRVDSDDALAAGFNVSTSLVNSPYEGKFLTGETVSTRGIVSAHVYLDANGNRTFDEGDESLPDVVVESINSREREKTNEKGFVTLKRLSPLLPTDIHVDGSSLPDPFMVSVNRGNSVLPRAGKIFDMAFPIQFSGEIDGTVSIADENGALKLARATNVTLIPVDPVLNEPVTAKAAQDGFYLLTPVSPGQYYLTVDAKDAKTLKGARPMPQILTFTHEGTSFYAQDIVLQQGLADIGFEVWAPGFIPDLQSAEPEYFISVGNQNASGILQSLYRMRMKDVVASVVAGLQPYTVESGETYYRVGAGGLEAAYGRCQMMSARKLPCSVSVLPVGTAPDVAVVPTKQASL